MGYGVAMGGGGGMTSTRATPLTLGALGSVAVNDDPKLSGYGGLVVETLDRNSVGTLFGVKLTPDDGKLRLIGWRDVDHGPAHAVGRDREWRRVQARRPRHGGMR